MAAPSAKRLPLNVKAPSISGDTIMMPVTAMPWVRRSSLATLAARKPP